MRHKAKTLLELYKMLLAAFGPRNWWPGDSPFEVAVGAILTQNTNWSNVTKAINALKSEGLLSFDALYRIPVEELAVRIRPSGYYNVKAKRLKAFFDYLFQEAGGDLLAALSGDLDSTRSKLLSVKGIGPETADSILLYAGGRPTFVVDAYTKRILHRHGMIPEEIDYEELRALFMDCLETDEAMFNEYHALLVCLGNRYCFRTKPNCDECPAHGWNIEP